MTAAPMLPPSSTSPPFTMKPLADSRMPLTDKLPGFRSPEGENPASYSPVDCGTTPGCSASRSVKERPFRGMEVIEEPVITSPICVFVVSTCTAVLETVTCCCTAPTCSFASALTALFASMTMFVC